MLSVQRIIYFDASALWFEQGKEQADECGFSSTCFAEDGGACGRLEIKAKVVYHIAIGSVIFVADVVESNTAWCIEFYWVALFFKGILFKFHQSLGSCEHPHEGGYKFCEVAGWSLYFVYQLQEGSHTAKGKSVSTHAKGCP